MTLLGEEMTEEMMGRLAGEIAKATADAIKTQQVEKRKSPSWIAVISVSVAIGAPVLGYQFSLSNRVSVLEAKADGLANASTQLAALTQKVTDFQREFEDWKIENGSGHHHIVDDAPEK